MKALLLLLSIFLFTTISSFSQNISGNECATKIGRAYYINGIRFSFLDSNWIKIDSAICQSTIKIFVLNNYAISKQTFHQIKINRRQVYKNSNVIRINSDLSTKNCLDTAFFILDLKSRFYVNDKLIKNKNPIEDKGRYYFANNLSIKNKKPIIYSKFNQGKIRLRE